MRVVYFTHSLLSCWNHGNAHFLRGVLRELVHRGHHVTACESDNSWSRHNLLRDHGPAAMEGFAWFYPELAPAVRVYKQDEPGELDPLLDRAELVIVHEWNDPDLITAIGRRRKHGGRFRLLFHDTHHRVVSDLAAIQRLDLSGYDAVLAFGEALAQVYQGLGWADRVFVWHEAADTRLFSPPAQEQERTGIVWIGNWGDDERSAELRDYLLDPSAALGLPLDIYGVRYPEAALAVIAGAGDRYLGWLPNAEVPSVFARHLFTAHVPRRFYATHLPGVPTIRVFEALACGIPLLSAPWVDAEHLFNPGRDFLMARDPEHMERLMMELANDGDLRRELSANGLVTIRARHTCAHRVDELLGTVAGLAETEAVLA
ncbi:MAG: glycosyltransferase [Acetobacteraceae bacterium]|nr:glycosyltransferase [Acetobacteraceae bacterium]